MAELTTYVGIETRTGICAVAIARGLRCVYGAAGTLTLAPIGVRGDYITLVDGAIGETVATVSASGGGKVAMQGAAANAAGDPCYSAANGQVSNTATSAVPMGRFTQPCSGAGVLVEVELEPVF